MQALYTHFVYADFNSKSETARSILCLFHESRISAEAKLQPFPLHFTELHLHWSKATFFPFTSHGTPSPLEHSYILSIYISPNSISTGAQLHPSHLHLTKLHLHWSIATFFPFTSHRTPYPLEQSYILSIYISRNSIPTGA